MPLRLSVSMSKSTLCPSCTPLVIPRFPKRANMHEDIFAAVIRSDEAVSFLLERIKGIIDSPLETHLGSVRDEISDLRTEVKKDLSELEERLSGRADRLDAKIDGVRERLGAFENYEIDKRL